MASSDLHGRWPMAYLVASVTQPGKIMVQLGSFLLFGPSKESRGITPTSDRR